MRTADFRGLGRSIGVAGVLIAVYLSVLIALGYVGQGRLRHALIEQEQLAIERQGDAVAYFLDSQRETLLEISESRAVEAFLANRALGMSPDYGLRASLLAVSRELTRHLDRKRAHERPVFRHIAFVDSSGKILVEVGDGSTDTGTRAAGAPVPPTDGRLKILRHDGNTYLTLSEPVAFKDRVAGFVTAQIDVQATVVPFLTVGTGAGERHPVALLGPDETVIATNSVDAPGNWRADALRRGNLLLSRPIPGSPLTLVAVPRLRDAQGFLSSPWFLGALALFSLPLLGGIAYLLRLNNHNLLLQARSQAATQQRAILRRQNERLQSEIDKRVRSERQLAYQANYDQLTNLPNRYLALDRLAQAIKRAKRDRGSVLVLFLGLDRFKQVNDSLGHSAGDQLLREAAQRLRSRVRESDTVSRLGGDEFLLICSDARSAPDWEQLAHDLLAVLEAPFHIGNHEFFVSASIGVAGFSDGSGEPQRLLKNAGIAMYAAKQQGRNRVCYYEPSMDAGTAKAIRLESSLRHALERRELQLAFQPIVDLVSGNTVAVEALLRWNSAELGAVRPDEFIPIAEETGLIHEIGEWVMAEACRTVGDLDVGADFRVAVNLSPKQLSRPGRLVDCTLHALRSSGLAPNQLELEVTESVLIDDRADIAKLLHRFDRIGVRLSIDDFGTGYSALNYLQRFPFDVLKIDRSFTQQVPGNPASASLVRAIIAMAHALDLEVIAEGIEDRTQTEFLQLQRCELGQGFLYSRPLSAAQLRAYLSSEDAQMSA